MKRCDCCGRRKKFFESFAHLQTDNESLWLCVDCNDLLYKMRDAASDNNRVYFEVLYVRITRRADRSSMFDDWLKQFVLREQARLK